MRKKEVHTSQKHATKRWEMNSLTYFLFLYWTFEVIWETGSACVELHCGTCFGEICLLPFQKLCIQMPMEMTTVLSVWESFIFEDETEYEYEIQVKVFVRVLKKKTPRGASSYFFSPKKLVRSFILKEVKPSSDGTMIKLLTFDNLLTLLRHCR